MKKFFLGLIFICQASLAVQVPLDIFNDLKNINSDSNVAQNHKKFQVLYFWATWCPSCKEKLKGPMKEIAKSQDFDLRFINTEKDADLVKNFLDREDIKFPVYLDQEKKLRKIFNVNPVPHWVLLSQNNNSYEVVASEVGWDWEKIKELIKNHQP